jgi:hypothetical protein
LEELLAEHNVEVGEKEKARLDKMADTNRRISRYIAMLNNESKTR